MICGFKQKTAYEMRSSDWSADLCSSYLEADADGKTPDYRASTSDFASQMIANSRSADTDEPEQSIYRTLCRFYLEWPLQCKFQSCSTIFKKTNCRFRPCKTQPRDRRESQQNPVQIENSNGCCGSPIAACLCKSEGWSIEQRPRCLDTSSYSNSISKFSKSPKPTHDG